MSDEIDWNAEPTLQECVDNLLDAMKRKDVAVAEIAYWGRKLRIIRERESEKPCD